MYDVDHLAPSSAEVKNEWSRTSTPPICVHVVDRDSRNYLYLYLYLYLVQYLATGWMEEDTGFQFRQGQQIFIFCVL